MALTTGTLIGKVPLLPGSVISGTEDKDYLSDLLLDGKSPQDPGTNDIINALGGDDWIFIYNGNDTVNAGEGSDQIYDEGCGNDVINGNGGDDSFMLDSESNDTANGGTGIDTVQYNGALGGVYVDLESGFNISKNGSVDTLISIENASSGWWDDVLLGSSAANTLLGAGGQDWIEGRGGDDVLQGGEGDDTINGGSGADLLRGGLGNDKMTGGADADTFVFGTGYPFLVGRSYGSEFGSCDTITDFQPGVDKIDVSALDARPDIAGDQAFKFDASPDGAWEEFLDGVDNPMTFSSSAGPVINGDPGEIEYRHEGGYTYVYFSPGDQLMDADLRLEGYITLTASDFIL
jgi:serralysin